MIRPYELGDVPQIVKLGSELSRLYDKVSVDFDPASLETYLWRGLDDRENFQCFVSQEKEAITGMLLCVKFSTFFSKNVTTQEVGFYVDPDSRGRTSFELIRAYEDWSKQVGATAIGLSHFVSDEVKDVGRLYSRLGYDLAEVTYIKRI